MPGSKYYPITREEFEPFITKQKFKLLNDPRDESRASWPADLRESNTAELVYGVRVTPLDTRLCLRVYSGILFSGRSRDVGDDAIRTLMVWMDIDDYEFGKSPTPTLRIVGIETRVHRIKTWAKNLQQRIYGWSEMLGPTCECGAPMILRHKKSDRKSKFWGCCRFADGCRNTAPYQGG